jgi:AraC-like DNA-binding protein
MSDTIHGMASLTLDWIQLAAIVGALQGLFLTGVLIAQRANRTANRLLAALMAAFTIYLAGGPYYAAGVVRVYPQFFAISYLMPWVFGPLVYLYARAACDRSWRFTWRECAHFLPVAIVFILATPVYMMSGPEKIAMWNRWTVEGLGPPLRSVDPLKYVSGIAYSAATVWYLRRHQHDVELSYSNIARVNLRWLFWLAVATGGIWLMATGLKLSHLSTSLRDGEIAFAMALLTYAIGYMGLRQPEIFRHAGVESAVVQQERVDARSTPDNPATPSSRYERSSLGEHEAAMLKGSLLALMDRKQPWKESELTLSDLAARLDSTPHKLSEVLNTQIGQTFYDFVNGYRVREVQRRITAGEARSLKILALAMDAGFASKSTFNEAFKKHTRQTPSSFRQTVGA